jgi:hypothetical protein
MHSIARPLSAITFPEFTGAQYYMVRVEDGIIPDEISPEYKALVTQMLADAGIAKPQPFFITVDEREVAEGESHRRGGVHIDGNYLFSWSGGGGNGWLNGVPGRELTEEEHTKQYRSRLGGTLIASNFPGCDVWTGRFFNTPGQGGSCEHMLGELLGMNHFTMEPNRTYVMNSTCIHKSMPLMQRVKRQLIRLTLGHETDVLHVGV